MSVLSTRQVTTRITHVHLFKVNGVSQRDFNSCLEVWGMGFQFEVWRLGFGVWGLGFEV
jgi:hypothetical protein